MTAPADMSNMDLLLKLIELREAIMLAAKANDVVCTTRLVEAAAPYAVEQARRDREETPTGDLTSMNEDGLFEEGR